MFYVHGATVFTPDREIADGAVLVDGAQIVAVGPAAGLACPAGAEVLDATGLVLTPGFIELQINGAFGHDFTAEPAAIWPVAAQLPRYGVTAFLPTIITSPPETVAEAQAVVMQPPAGFCGALPLGLHVEGPFLNPQKKGAHNPAYLRPPSPAAVQDWMPERGVRLVTLAPELPGALETIRALVANRVVVSAGHSMATYDEAMAGFAAGIRYGTHLFNAMPAFNHRDPGLPGALLTDPRVVVGFIADGVHTHPSVIGLVWRALGGRRLSLVSDAMAALGMPSGQHRLGDFDVWVDATSARLADGTLAGSILALDQALRNLRNVPVRGMAGAGCTLTEALPTVTTTPADLLDLGDSPPRLRRSGRGAKPPCGTASRLAPGHQADLTLLTSDLQVQATIVAGRVVYTR